jgi:hypothetical protein
MASSAKGYNPLRWDCEKRGCFNQERRPKIEQFSDCFPGRINFGDVDGIVEINGYALILEWKTSVGDKLPMGQQIMYKNITKPGNITVIVIVGNAKTMDCESYCFFYRGKQSQWVSANLKTIKNKIKNWSNWVKTKKTRCKDGKTRISTKTDQVKESAGQPRTAAIKRTRAGADRVCIDT